MRLLLFLKILRRVAMKTLVWSSWNSSPIDIRLCANVQCSLKTKTPPYLESAKCHAYA